MQKKISMVQCILTVVFVSALLISNIVASRTLSFPFGITMSGGAYIFPLTYVLSDLFSEVYGYKWSRITCYLAFAMNLFMVAIFTLVIKTPSIDTIAAQQAFSLVLGNTPRLLVASLTAFVVGDFVNDKVFAMMKRNHKDHTGFGTRAITSSVLGTLIDTTVWTLIAFFGTLNVATVISIIASEIISKTLYEIAILPITMKVVHYVSRYENNIQ